MASSDSNILEEELRGLKDLVSVAQVVVSSIDLDEVLSNILMSSMAIMEMPAGSIALYDDATGMLKLHVHEGLSPRLVERNRWRVKQGGLTAEILDRGELFIVEDTDKADFFNNPLALSEGIRSLIAVPLKIQDKIVGVLYLDDFTPRQFPEQRLKLLSILASFATMSIDNARLHHRTQQLACTDGLTGLFNHRMFTQLFREEFHRTRRYRNVLSLMMLDVDDFKAFNDTHGHPEGDRVLVAVSEILRETLRDCDICFRYGGEEFVAILPETEIGEALPAAERVRQRIAEDSLRHSKGENAHPVSVSIGVASFPRDGSTHDELLKVVDDLMYVAKKSGKNRVYHLDANGPEDRGQALSDPHFNQPTEC